MNIFVTGASGFIGGHLLKPLLDSGYGVTATYHTDLPENIPGIEQVSWKKLDLNKPEEITTELLKNHDVVIHLAALAHVQKSINKDKYFNINTIGTKALVDTSIKAGVKQLVYLSTIKVNGEFNMLDENGSIMPFSADDALRPVGPYAESKRDAERLLKNACNETGMAYTIFRTPIIYGPGVRANVYDLINAVAHRIPLPLAAIKNRRSMLYVKNLADILVQSIEKTNAQNKLYLVKDIDISTTELINSVAKALNIKAILISIPGPLLKMLCAISGRTAVYQKLTTSLCLEDTKTREELDWSPPYSFSDGLQETVNWYLSKGNGRYS